MPLFSLYHANLDALGTNRPRNTLNFNIIDIAPSENSLLIGKHAAVMNSDARTRLEKKIEIVSDYRGRLMNTDLLTYRVIPPNGNSLQR